MQQTGCCCHVYTFEGQCLHILTEMSFNKETKLYQLLILQWTNIFQQGTDNIGHWECWKHFKALFSPITHRFVKCTPSLTEYIPYRSFQAVMTNWHSCEAQDMEKSKRYRWMYTLIENSNDNRGSTQANVRWLDYKNILNVLAHSWRAWEAWAPADGSNTVAGALVESRKT